MLIPTNKLVEMLKDTEHYTEEGIAGFAAFNDADPVLSGLDWKAQYCSWVGISIPLECASPRNMKETIPQSLRTKVFERDAYRCKFCGDWHGLTVDHIFPESKGGTLDFDNLQTLCKNCNSKKGDRIQ